MFCIGFHVLSYDADFIFKMIPFVGLREAQNLLNDAQVFSNRPHRIQNLMSVTMSYEVIPTPGVEIHHIGIFVQASYLRV